MNCAASPLSLLCTQIHSSIQASKEFVNTLRQSEAATRVVLIDPVLKLLGWDVSNLHCVEIEKSKNNLRVDYCLKRQDGTVFAIVEAKCLGSDLDKPDVPRQIGDYQRTFITKDMWLTDGIRWHLYDDYDPTQPPKRHSLIEDDPVDLALRLLHKLDVLRGWSFTLPAATGYDVIDQLRRADERIAKLETTVTQFVTRGATNSVRVGADSNEPDAVNQHGGWRNMKDCGHVSCVKVTAVRLPDGTEVPVKYWKEVLAAVAEFVLAKLPSIELPIYDSSRGKRLLISCEKSTMRQPQTLLSGRNGQTVYVETNYSANTIIEKSLHLVGFLGNKDVPQEVAVLLQGQ